MTAAEKLLELSSITVCATAAEHFCSITADGGSIVYIPTDELEGVATEQIELLGVIHDEEELEGKLIENIELIGEIDDDELSGQNENINELKGDL